MSLPATAAQLCEWTGGRLQSGQPTDVFSGTGIDSREIGRGDLFVAIVGPNHDAHRFVAQVLSGGAAGALVQTDRIDGAPPTADGFVVEVEDTTRALADLARGHRRSFAGPLIGITGSNGKTTTKELCAGILSGCAPTLATRGNLNNHFGVPLTLLRREADDAYAVVEMGMNHRGEIAVLAEIARPTIGLLTNVGTAHIEFLGSRENIALETPFGRGEIRVPGLAETIVENALAAAGGALAAGVSFEAVVTGLASHRGVPGRMQPRPFPNEVLVIDDSYNANPQSMQSALETLARLETRGQRIAVLGQMGELGDTDEAAHRELGRLAGRLGLDALLLIGDSAEIAAEGARAAGLDESRIHIAEDHASLADTLETLIGPGDRVLVKGSRAARMERVIELLAEVGG